MTSRRLRKQKVALRFRRREQIKTVAQVAAKRSVIAALIVGIGMGVAMGRNSLLSQFMRTHTPAVRMNQPQALVGIPALQEVPANTLWLWVPGVGTWMEKQICRKYPAVKKVRVSRSWTSNTIQLYLEPRVPLVMWNGQGFDREGVIFQTLAAAWKALPQASFNPNASRIDLGAWLYRMSAYYPMWSQIAAIKQDAYGTIEVILKSGIVIVWGSAEKEPSASKAQAMLRVIDDMHTHSGGTARADLRFFDQGRIIVVPKSARAL